ncbi:MAG: outer membrane beta-barrel family protein, partial [Chitinophagaceae bacterium]
KDLGNIKIETDTKQLEEVVVNANRGMLQLGIDRKVFNVDKNLTSQGGTAVDVMKNVPSVNVDIDGNVSLRNAAPQIFVDGRPTTLTLEQIPADAISSVEIITNPSAKFDASGGGSGILNIVLKKARKTGYNGSLRANMDSRLKFGLGGDINVKQGKINLFANTMFNQRKSKSTASSDRRDFFRNGQSFLGQENAPINEGYFLFGRMGIDYFVDNRNTFTIAGSMARGTFNSDDRLNIQRDTTLPGYFSSELGNRTSDGAFNFRNYGSTFSYKHNFAKSGKEITADANYNYSTNGSSNFYQTQFFNVNNTPKTPMLREQISGNGRTRFLTVQTDFVNPITDKIKVEMGVRTNFRDFTSLNDNKVFNASTGAYVTNPRSSNNYDFKDNIYAAYTTFGQQVKKFSYQLGLRIESSEYKGRLVNKNQEFNNKYPFSLFPSVFLSNKINDNQDIQLNYSRKINRPNFFQLIPFIDSIDFSNISRGNPALVPEFTNLIEFSYQVNLGKGNNLLSTVYYRNTQDLITRIQFKDVNPNSSSNDSVFINSYANASNSHAYGLELTAKNKLASWWDMTSNINFYNSSINSTNVQGGFDNSRLSYFAKLNNTFKLPKNFSIQLSGDYQSKTIIPISQGGGGGRGGGGGGGGMFGGGQLATANGIIKPNYGVDIAIRKEFLKNNVASLSLSMNDVFRTKKYSTTTEDFYFIQNSERRRDPQILRLNFNYRFGKFDVSLFKRKNLKGEAEGVQGGMQGIGN